MKGSSQRGKDLTTAAVSVLNRDRGLLVFPAITFLVPVLSVATVIVIIASGISERSVFFFETLPILLIALLIFPFLGLCEAALIASVLALFKGGNTAISEGLRSVWRHFWPIMGFTWESTFYGGGASYFGSSWHTKSSLSLPLIISEDLNTRDAIQRSHELIRRTWGTKTGGIHGPGLFTGTALLAAAGAGLVLIMILKAISELLLPVALLVVLAVLGAIALNAALKSIHKAAVFLYASENLVAAPFEEDDLRNAFGPER